MTTIKYTGPVTQLVNEDNKSVELRVVRQGWKSDQLPDSTIERLLLHVEQEYKDKGFEVTLPKQIRNVS